jgi:preprotein translocase subunit SecG
MMTFVLVIHAFVCILLALIILMQSGRGGGLTEQFASAESIFGAQTNTLLVKTTTIMASVFLVTCLSLAVLSSMKGKSLMGNRVAVPLQTTAPASPAPSPQVGDKSGSIQVSDPVPLQPEQVQQMLQPTSSTPEPTTQPAETK